MLLSPVAVSILTGESTQLYLKIRVMILLRHRRVGELHGDLVKIAISLGMMMIVMLLLLWKLTMRVLKRNTID